MQTDDTAVPVLERAKALLLRGWAQGRIVRQADGGAAWCLVGAINRAAFLEHATSGATDGAVGAVRDVVGRPLAQWNDHPDRTIGEVIKSMEQAIERQGSG